MWDFSVVGAIKLLGDTLPFVGLRMAVSFGMTSGYVLVSGIGAGIGHGVGWPGAAFWGGVAGIGLFGVFAHWLREFTLYRVRAAHLAVLAGLMQGAALPGGRAQLRHAGTVVHGLFAETRTLFAVDRLIKGVVRAVNGMVRGILVARSFPGVRQLACVAQMLLRAVLGFVDELILARIMLTGTDNPWRSAQEALILYGQNYRIMLKNAAWLAVIVHLLCLLVFVVMLIPATMAAAWMPEAWAAVRFPLALLLTWNVKAALIEPLVVICLMQVYFDAIDGQSPDPEWGARMEQMSDRFRQLKMRALSTAGDVGNSGRTTLTV